MASFERDGKLRSLLTTGRFASEISLKNCVKRVMGRKTRPNEDAVFLRQYLLHVLGIRRIGKITSAEVPGEGAGSQAFYIMNAINLAHVLGLTYVHTPFSSICHADRPMEEFVAAWESLFNLGAGEAVCGANRSDAINLPYAWRSLYPCLDLRGREEELARHFARLAPEFRRRYYLNKSPRLNDRLTVAVHIRRGDVGLDNPESFTSNEIVLRTIRSAKEILDRQAAEYSMRVYSEGRRAEFEELCLPGIELFLDADPVWTMEELIEADILIMAKGFYSYYAGTISDGIKIHWPRKAALDDFPGSRWVHVVQPEDWVACAADGTFDGAAFERQLRILMQSKIAR